MGKQNDYLTNYNNSGFRIGQKVKLLRVAETHENGWSNSWEEGMSKYIGEIGTISIDHGMSGFIVYFDEVSFFNYPYFVLGKLRKEKIKKLL